MVSVHIIISELIIRSYLYICPIGINLILELNANVVYVPITLSRVVYGFIGFILSPPTYATLVPFAPFLIPQHSGPLPQVHDANQYEIAHTKTIHDKGLETFHSYQLV